MNKTKRTTNPKKLRRRAKTRLDRPLTARQVQLLYEAACRADAPVIAEKIVNIRAGITVAEALTLVRLINVEAAANGSYTRVIAHCAE